MTRPTTTGRFAPHHDLCDKGFGHGYLTVYDRLLIGVDVTSILEVGVMDGASLSMWRSVFPAAAVTAVENDEHRAAVAAGLVPSANVIVGDAYSRSVAEQLAGPFDFIVDDGSHRFEDQLAFLELYCPMLASGGVLVVEDILPPHPGQDAMVVAEALLEAVPAGWRDRAYIVDCRWPGSAYGDDLLVVVDDR